VPKPVAKPSLFVRIQFSGGHRFGPGKADLLAAIDRTGSIAEAARSMRMSYRRAWLLVDSTNRLFGRPVVTAGPGGRRGGGAALTSFGREMVRCYHRMIGTMARSVAPDLARFRRWAS